MNLNPIRSVQGATSDGTPGSDPAVTTLPTVTGYSWEKYDISDPTAGRVLSQRMLKKRIGRAVKLMLEWDYLTFAQGSAVLQAFSNEYSNIEFLDAESGTWVTKTFYTGDLAAPLYNAELGYWETIMFNVIQSIPD